MATFLNLSDIVLGNAGKFGQKSLSGGNTNTIPNLIDPAAAQDPVTKSWGEDNLKTQFFRSPANVDQTFFTIVTGNLNIEFGWDSVASQPFLEEKGGANTIDLDYFGTQSNVINPPFIENKGIAASFTIPISTKTYFDGEGPSPVADDIFGLIGLGTSDNFDFKVFSINQNSTIAIFSRLIVALIGNVVIAYWDFEIFEP